MRACQHEEEQKQQRHDVEQLLRNTMHNFRLARVNKNEPYDHVCENKRQVPLYTKPYAGENCSERKNKYIARLFCKAYELAEYEPDNCSDHHTQPNLFSCLQ